MKVSGSAASLMQGVSQQIPQERSPGQHTTQINMLPDPVQGLSRRHGSRWQAEAQTTYAPSDMAVLQADTDNWRSFEYSNAGSDFVVFSRRAVRPVGSPLPVLLAYNRTAKAFLTYVRPLTDAALDTLEAGGVSAMASIGKYVFMAGNTVSPTATSTARWDTTTNTADAVVWVRGGAYARTYHVKATKTDNSVVEFEYKTPTSSYPNTLDTSDVPVYAADPAGGTQTDTESAYIVLTGSNHQAELSWHAWQPTALTAKKGATTMTNVYPAAPATNLEYSWAAGTRYVLFEATNLGALDVSISYTHTKTVTNPNYAKTVTDITNAFNSAVTNWIGTAADAIQPEAIAESMRLAAVAAGLVTATREASTVIFDNVKGLTVDDGGDGSLIRGVANEVTSVDGVSDIHKVGKIVKVRARNAAEAFYLKAAAQDSSITSGYTQVTWVEAAGVEHAVTSALVYATVSGGSIYVASSAALLTSIVAGAHPNYAISTCGDTDSSPLPFFIGKQITYLGVFQDRLLVGAGAVVRCSKTGDYLNFFRSSVLTAPADDPLEMLSQGSEDDTLRHSVIYDRDLVIFGDKRQYAVSGRAVLSPTNSNMPVMSSHANAAQIPPLAVGGAIFYGQVGEVASSVHQITPGPVAESPESFIVSSQVDTYLSGSVIELSNLAKPTHLFVRTTGARSSVFTFTYLDKQGSGRVQDAWYRLDFSSALGPIIGMNRTADGLLLFFLRQQRDAGGTLRVYLVADLCVFTTGLSTYPYLDSIRPLAQVTAGAGSVHLDSEGEWYTAFDSTSEWQFVGDSLAATADLLTEFPAATGPRVGHLQHSEFVPTNPFTEDKNGKAITTGTLTVTLITFSLAKSAGMRTGLTAREATDQQDYTARVVGSPDDLVGRETVSDLQQTVPVFYETREYTLSVQGLTWLPFTITAVEWVGQWFNRTQRL